jgi:uncharacterized protein (TIGR00255 family)
MIKSMTGYGKAHVENERLEASVEIKTLNSKYIDVSLRLPRLFSDREIEVRQFISEKLQRGKVSVVVDFRGKDELSGKPSVNEDLLTAYYRIYQKVATRLEDRGEELFRLAVQSPDVLQPSVQENADEKIWQQLRDVIAEAIEQCEQFRVQEGAALLSDFTACIDEIHAQLAQIKKLIPQRDQRIRERLRTQIDESIAKDKVDENRFEQELIYYIEKLDINEEIVRLSNHLAYFGEVLDKQDAPGKKLGFISQEIGREINTIGSKANDADVQRCVVNMKEELEKIKEQVLNVV